MPAGKDSVNSAAWEAAELLMKNQKFLTLQDTDEIYRYEDGIYLDDGEAYTKKKIQANAGQGKESTISIHLINEALGHIRRSTQVGREIFEETNPHLVLENCLLNIETLEQEPFTPNYHALSRMPVTYNPSIDYKKSRFWSFINQILPEVDVQGVQEELGAILRKKYLTKKISIWVGDTDTGKTTLASVFLALLGGDENVSSVPIQQLASRDRFAIADLYGKMANIRDDLTKDVVNSIGNLKELTGGFQVRGERKFQNGFYFVNHAFILYTCNVLPPVEEDDNAFWNRVILRKFARRYGGQQKPDRELLAKLVVPEELSAVLNWGLEGLKRLRENGWNFTDTSTVDQTREEYKRRSDPIWAYANECLVEESGGFVFKEALFNDFKVFCRDAGIPLIARDVFLAKLPEKVTVESGQRQDPMDKKEDGTPKRKHAFIGIRLALVSEKAVQGERDEQSAQGAHPAHPQDQLSGGQGILA
jgi:putative DNA primase/helicase